MVNDPHRLNVTFPPITCDPNEIKMEVEIENTKGDEEQRHPETVARSTHCSQTD